MTLERLKSVGILVGAALLVAGWLVALYALGRAHESKQSARRFEERQRAIEAGIAAALEAKDRDVASAIDALVEERHAFALEVERLRSTFPDAQGVEIVTFDTPEFEIVCERPPSSDEPASPSSQASGAPGDDALEGSALEGVFRFRLGGTWGKFKTAAGSLVGAGSVEVYQTHPEPERLVATLPLRVQPGDWILEGEDSEDWLVGPVVGIADGGGAGGLAVVAPAWRPNIIGWRPRVRPFGVLLVGAESYAVAGGALVGF